MILVQLDEVFDGLALALSLPFDALVKAAFLAESWHMIEALRCRVDSNFARDLFAAHRYEELVAEEMGLECEKDGRFEVAVVERTHKYVDFVFASLREMFGFL